jgi:proteasome lid subunit RPN8/RPN11
VQRRRKLAGESDLDAHDGYCIDERELLQALRRAEQQGEVLRVIYHSHVDTGAYFSHADSAAALGPHGAPLWPGVAQLVVSVYESGVRDAAYFEWDEDVRVFRGRSVARPG